MQSETGKIFCIHLQNWLVSRKIFDHGQKNLSILFELCFTHAVHIEHLTFSRRFSPCHVAECCVAEYEICRDRFFIRKPSPHLAQLFEQAFIGRVAAGDTAAVIHAVKTKCRDRGYNDKVEVVHSGSITNEHTVSIAELDLPIETRQEVLTALRAKLQAEGMPNNDSAGSE